MSQNVGRLGVVMALDTAEFVSGLGKAKSSLMDFAKNAAPNVITGVAVAFAGMTYKALQFADQMSDTAKANDVAIESILKLSSSLQLAGGHGEDAGKLLAKFNSTVDEAAQGSKSAQESFSRIGITLRDIGKLSTEQLFEKSVASLAKIEDTAKRTRIAIELFGKAIKGVDIKELAEGIARGDEGYKKYAEAIKIAGELNDKLESKTKKTVIMFTNAFLPTLNTVFDELNKGGGFFEKMFFIGGEALKGFVYGMKTIIDTFKLLWEWLSLIGNVMVDIATFDWGAIAKHNKQYTDYLANLNKERKEFATKLMTPPKTKDNKDPFTGRETIEGDKAALMAANQLTLEYAMQSYLKYEQLKRQRELVELTNNEKQVAEAVYKIEDEKNQKILEIEKKIAEERGKAKPSQAVIDKLKEQIPIIEAVAEAYKKLTEEEVKSQQEQQRTFEFGWNKSFKQFVEDAGNNAKVASEMFNSLVSNMGSALDNFVDKGKFSFRSLTESILKDLLKIALRSSAMKMFGSFGLGSLFGGSNVTGLDSLPSSVNRTFADGGSPPVGVPSLVGERGPELFIPNTAGTIIPNNQLASAMGGGQQVIYNGPYIQNMQAIDTQSASQFLAKNKDAVWAANQSANRSMPSSR